MREEGIERGKIHFYPRPPGGGRHRYNHHGIFEYSISIHALRVEGDRVKSGSAFAHVSISIHALRVEGDVCPFKLFCYNRISIHALRVEGDIGAFLLSLRYGLFLSTPSGWRATARAQSEPLGGRNFYPRPPGGGRRSTVMCSIPRGLYFYPRPPGGGRPCGELPSCTGLTDFYPRPPGGGRRDYLC